MTTDTITAIATPLGGEGGIGVVRISGPDSTKIIPLIIKPSSKEALSSHRVRHGWIVDNSVDIDQAMLSLSTYVGHAKVSNTYWYMSAVPQMMALAAGRFESFISKAQVQDE